MPGSCHNTTLTDPQRDRCGLWYQFHDLALHEQHPLPSCTDFILDRVQTCTLQLSSPVTLGTLVFKWVSYQQHLIWACDTHGRVQAIKFWPAVMDVRGGPVPRLGGGQTPQGCVATLSGSLAPELAVLSQLQHVDTHKGAADLHRHCRTITWWGMNLTGTIPSTWGQLNLTSADFRGNTGLEGDLPSEWSTTIGNVRIAGTELQSAQVCHVDCFNPTLTGEQRDKCGIWHQLSRMKPREFWLPPCIDFIYSNRRLGTTLLQQPIHLDGFEADFLGSEHTLTYACDQANRIFMLTIWPLVTDEYGVQLLPTKHTPGTNNCQAVYEGSLAPELAALDHLKWLDAVAPSWFYARGPHRHLFNCTTIRWMGNNLTGSIPKSWDRLGSLEVLVLHGNRGLTGRIPRSLWRMKGDRSKRFVTTATNISQVTPNALDKAKMCKASQRNQASLLILQDHQVLFFGINLNRSHARGFFFGDEELPPFSSPQSYYCGKEKGMVHVATAWAMFLFLVLAATLVQLGWWWQHRHKRATARPQGWAHAGLWVTLWVRLKHLLRSCRVPVFIMLSLYDIISDVMLACDMFPSWTTWFVLVGVSLPSTITVALLAVQVASQKQQDSNYSGPSSCITFLAMTGLILCSPISLPLLVLGLLFEQHVLQSRSRWSVWMHVDLARLATLYSGLTACTEDVFTMAFTTVGFALMATAPWRMYKTNVYFSLWAFWQSLVTSMIHFMLGWSHGLHLTLEQGNLSWVRAAFRGLVVTTGGGAAGGQELVCRGGGGGLGKVPMRSPSAGPRAPTRGPLINGGPAVKEASPHDKEFTEQ